MTDLVFLLSADIDIQQAYEYYENYQEGRGDFIPATPGCRFYSSATVPRDGTDFPW
jgi:hypothetical protein